MKLYSSRGQTTIKYIHDVAVPTSNTTEYLNRLHLRWKINPVIQLTGSKDFKYGNYQPNSSSEYNDNT